MSDTTTNPVIKIKNADEFRAVAAQYNVNCGDRGRLPMRELSRILVAAQLDGKVTCVDTDYFPISRWALGETIGTRKNRDAMRFVITYTVKGNDKAATLTLTENEIRSYLPNVKGIIGGAFATMAVALHLNVEESDAPLSALVNYTVLDVKRVEAPVEQPQVSAEDTKKPADGEDTSEAPKDADKAPEAVKTDVPELVPAESKPARTTRARAASVKAAKTAKPSVKAKVSA